jgi:hypothetical protein
MLARLFAMIYPQVREVFCHRGPAEASEGVEERTDAHFGDAAMVPLFVQENYVRRMPQQAPPPRTAPKELQMHWVRMLETVADAAESISVSDVIDQRVHAEQLWELAPAHAFFSTVLPGHLCQDSDTSNNKNVYRSNGNSRIEFPAVLGNTSRTNKQRRTALQMCDALMLTDGQFASRDMAFYILPLLRDICLALVDPKTSDATVNASSSWFSSRQRCRPLTIDTLGHACAELQIDEEQMALLEDAIVQHEGKMPPAAYAKLVKLRAPGTLLPYDAFCDHLNGTANTIKTWRDMLQATDYVSEDNSESPTVTLKKKPVTKGKGKSIKTAVHSPLQPSSLPSSITGVDQVAIFCATHHIDKELFERIVTWFEFLLPVDQRFAKRVPTTQKAALTRAINKAAEDASTERVRIPLSGKGTKVTGAKRKLDDMLTAQSDSQDARLLSAAITTPEEDDGCIDSYKEHYL